MENPKIMERFLKITISLSFSLEEKIIQNDKKKALAKKKPVNGLKQD